MQNNTNPLPWHIVEQQISQEINWLKLTIPIFNKSDSNDCECDYRRIAIGIVTGKIYAKEIKNQSNDQLWEHTKNPTTKHKHGKDWHKEMMDILDSYFLSDGFKVVTDPL